MRLRQLHRFSALPKAIAQSKVDTPPDEGFMVKGGKDRFDEETLFGHENTLKCKVSTKDTDGALYIVEQSDKDRSGPPLHVHPGQDEWFKRFAEHDMKIVGP